MVFALILLLGVTWMPPDGRGASAAVSNPVYLPLVITIGGGSARPWPDTSAAILPFDDQVDTRGLTEAQWAFVASHYAGTQKVTRDTARHLRQYNPNFLVLHYRLGQTLGYRIPQNNCAPTGGFLQIVDGNSWVQEWPGDSVVQDAWFYKYNGSRVFDCSWGHYLMDLDSPAWRARWSAQVIQQLQDNEDDGLFADSYNVPNYGFTWKPPLPGVDSVFEKAWAAKEHAFTDFIQSKFAGRWKWIPNIGGWITTRDPSDYTNLDGAMIEGFAEWGGGSYIALGDWQLKQNRLLPLSAAGKILIGQTYPDPANLQERMFVLGSYLLLKGSHTYINLETSMAPEWYPEYGINLGAAVDALPGSINGYYQPVPGIYGRHFARGLVLVNPGSSDQIIPLGKIYYQVTPSGGGLVPADGSAPGTLVESPVSSVTLHAHQAAVLTNNP